MRCIFRIKMLRRTYCASCIGVDSITVTIEVDVTQGISFYLVGLPDSAVRESQQRITTALKAVGAKIPGKRIVVNMAPADIRKEGSSFDLAIAVGILAATDQYLFNSLDNFIIMGELALDGSLRPVKGVLPVAVHARRSGFRGCIFPAESAREAAEIDGIDIYGVRHLEDVISILSGESRVEPMERVRVAAAARAAEDLPDFGDILGQESAKRALEIAAAGNHNILLCGTPGSGKTIMAKATAGILPEMTRDESLETSKIYSVAGKSNPGGGLMRERPFRSPHHSSSACAIAGGGTNSVPGEISLAHNGILYLDEIAEFPRHVLDLLRQPMEERVVHVSRLRQKLVYPANFMLMASMNPCPCGFYGQPGDRCTCTPFAVSRYLSKISGPLMDRIDMHIDVQPVTAESLTGESRAESSSAIRERVEAARRVQHERFSGEYDTNAQIPVRDMKKYCHTGPAETRLLTTAISRLNLSARSYSRILKVARTIADLDSSQNITVAHLAEAIQYRGASLRRNED